MLSWNYNCGLTRTSTLFYSWSIASLTTSFDMDLTIRSSMLPETDQHRVAMDGLPYSLNEFRCWYGVGWWRCWDHAPVYDLQKHADDVAEAEGVCPGTPSDIDMVSDEESPLIAEFDVVCCTRDGREFTVTCDGMTSIGWLRMRVSEIVDMCTESVYILHHGVELSDEYSKVHLVFRQEDDKRLRVYSEDDTRLHVYS